MDESPPDPVDRVRGVERTLIAVRWFAAAFALVQVYTYYLPYPQGAHEAALGVIAALALGNLALWAAHARWHGQRAARRLAAVGMAFDIAIAMAFVTVYTFDVNTAMFALLYLLPLLGAIRYGRSGALVAMAIATAGYVAREAWGSMHYGYDLLPASISYRMGIGFIIAAVAGTMAARYEREHRRVRAMYQHERDAAAQLRAAEDLRTTFLTAVSHELRTPLASILGLAMTINHRLDTEGEFDDTDREMLEHVEAEARRLDLLLADLLDLERLARGRSYHELLTVEVAKLVRRVTERLDQAHERDVELDLSEVEVQADPAKVERILENLLANAFRYTPHASPLRVTTRPWERGVLLRVEDRGDGVPAELRQTIFEPFRRGDKHLEHAPGTGIGLSLVRRFSELHHGRAWVEPRDGGGSAFCVYLPADPRVERRRSGRINA